MKCWLRRRQYNEYYVQQQNKARKTSTLQATSSNCLNFDNVATQIESIMQSRVDHDCCAKQQKKIIFAVLIIVHWINQEYSNQIEYEIMFVCQLVSLLIHRNNCIFIHFRSICSVTMLSMCIVSFRHLTIRKTAVFDKVERVYRNVNKNKWHSV